MPTPRTEVRNGITFEWNEYGPDEMIQFWKEQDRYHFDAMRMHNGCVVTECSESKAAEISAAWVNTLFAIPTCTYYDGAKLSLCCDYAGSGTGRLIEQTRNLIKTMLTA